MRGKIKKEETKNNTELSVGVSECLPLKPWIRVRDPLLRGQYMSPLFHWFSLLFVGRHRYSTRTHSCSQSTDVAFYFRVPQLQDTGAWVGGSNWVY